MRILTAGTVFLATLVWSCGNDEKAKASTANKNTSKYNEAFNGFPDTTLSRYNELNEAFVHWDTAAINAKAHRLAATVRGSAVDLNAVSEADKSKVTAAVAHLDQFTTDIAKLPAIADLTAKRHVYNDASQHLYDFLNTLQYDRTALYLHECTMPYNDTGRGVWVSRNEAMEERRNPYLGTKHPRYHDGMLNCGSVAATIDYTKK